MQRKKKDDVEVDKKAVAQMLKQLDEAEKGNKNQTAQDLRDKLNEKRKELGEEKFKEILEALKKDASSDLLALLKKLFPDFSRMSRHRHRLLRRSHHQAKAAVVGEAAVADQIRRILAPGKA